MKEYLDRVGSFTIETFKPHKGDTFIHVAENGRKIELKLIDIEAPQREDKRVESFSLIFAGPKDAFFPQERYLLEHEALGNLPLFMVPIGGDERGYSYQVLFSRLNKKK